MNPAACQPTARAEPGATDARPPAPPLLWGCGIASLHDLFWASRCIQVVRPGSEAALERHGPALYLLLSERQLVHLPIAQILKRMHWASPRALRLRVLMHDSADYTEHVEAGPAGVRFRRSYKRPLERSDRVWITGDPAVAALWAAAPTLSAARQALRTHVKAGAVESMAVEGEVHDSQAPADAERWLDAAMTRWQNPNAVLEGLYEYQRGVWVDESASIAPGARIHGPAWIGAGVEIPDSGVVIGPVIIPDAPHAAGARHPGPVDWTLVRSPHWALPSLVSGGSARRALKRAFDIAFSLAVLAGTLPLYPLIMLAIFVEDRRPFFFAHARQTLGGREFPCLKFRTMRRDAEQMKAQLEAANAADGPQFFIQNDPRVTRVGHFLRRFQLDELPQFINVLLGHMSVVGPRPSPDKENQYCPAWREIRLSVRPGITGLWQVSRTRMPQTDFQEWIRYDLEYVQHQSFIGDLRIILETVRRIVKT